MSRLLHTVLLLFLPFALHAEAQSDSLDLSVLPSCARPDLSEIVFPGERAAFDRLYAKLDSVRASQRCAVNVWHVGGSHVQGAILPNRIMENLNGEMLGHHGDRGVLFPRALAKTNRDKSYGMNTTGEWDAPMLTKASAAPKPRYGVSGFAARTADTTASVSLSLGEMWQFNRLRVLGYGSSPEAYPYVLSGSDTLRFNYDEAGRSYVFGMKGFVDSVDVRFNIPEGESFVLTGLHPTGGRSGINYFSSGVNGAAVTSWVDQCADLQNELYIVNPDLVIFGLGINDSACTAKRFSPEKFKGNYRRLMSMIRKVNPSCAFVFLTNNDSYRYVRRGMAYNENAPAVRKAMMELAAESGGCVWDLFGVMGGSHTVLKWRDAGLIKADKLHFTEEGYTLVADMFCKALLEDYRNSKESTK